MSDARPSYEDLLELVQQQQRHIQTLQDEVSRLQAALDEARRSGKRQAAPFRKGPPKAHPRKPGRKPGDRHGTHGHRPPPAPEHIDEVLEAALPDACPHCRGALVEAEVVHQYQTDIPRKPLTRQFNVHVGHCQDCGRRAQGRPPLQTSDALGACASQVGPDAQAAIVTLNKAAGLSHAKVADCFGSLLGIDLTRGASAQIVLRAGERLQPAYADIVEATAQSDRLSVDETGWRVGGRPAWLHVWVGEKATCYRVDQSRSADALQEVIGIGYDGLLVHDGFASYDRFKAAAHQRCTAHVLRRAKEMLQTATRGAVRFPRQVIGLFSEAIHLKNERLAGRVGDAAWQGARDRMEDRLLELPIRPRAGPGGQALSNHLYDHFACWLGFLSDPSIPATNWEAEQAIRPAVVNRKVWGGNRTESGAQAQGVLTSVLRTCQQQARSALDFVSGTLRAFGNRFLATPAILQTR